MQPEPMVKCTYYHQTALFCLMQMLSNQGNLIGVVYFKDM